MALDYFRTVDENALVCVSILIEHGVDYKFKDFYERNILHGNETFLHDAVSHNWEAVVRVLLENGARTDIEDMRGKTPLRLARDQKLDGLFDLLRSARLKEQDDDEHPRRYAMLTGNTNDDSSVQPRRTDTLMVDYKMPIDVAVGDSMPQN
ncbi:putative ankyrin repeat-containing [Rosellinia necatrix]|uniref:Putative ankyrin repeat-containing n=1 Tax=Rosellinia necatrix TaxID=77044 RepID=A0A1S8A4X3_ROSNE|nr:putative ankyrin repeat-containing [Rosellinia necatrix]